MFGAACSEDTAFGWRPLVSEDMFHTHTTCEAGSATKLRGGDRRRARLTPGLEVGDAVASGRRVRRSGWRGWGFGLELRRVWVWGLGVGVGVWVWSLGLGLECGWGWGLGFGFRRVWVWVQVWLASLAGAKPVLHGCSLPQRNGPGPKNVPQVEPW